ncbi:MAG: PEP-CTERM sorting domain-containing protein [Gemmataceae bacterium]
MLRSWKFTVLTAALAAAALAGRADAGLIPTNVSVAPDGTNFRWTYAVVVTTDVKVNPGDYFTIYDFGGLVAGQGQSAVLANVVAPTDWTISSAMTGPTPAGTSPADDPGIINLTFKYAGATPINGQLGLGNFSAISQYGDSVTSDFTSITHRQVDGRTEANITSTDVPVPGAMHETPEPATLAMFGVGLPLLGVLRYLRRRINKA